MLDPAGILEWVRNAKAGDMAVYGRGETLSRQVAAIAVRLQEQGLVDLTRRREGRGWQFLIQRRTKPFGTHRVRLYGVDSAEAVILRMVREAIRLKQPCPTNQEFAEAAGLPDRLAASYRLRRLVSHGKLLLIDHGPFERRQAVDVRSGEMTVRGPL